MERQRLITPMVKVYTVHLAEAVRTARGLAEVESAEGEEILDVNQPTIPNSAKFLPFPLKTIGNPTPPPTLGQSGEYGR